MKHPCDKFSNSRALLSSDSSCYYFRFQVLHEKTKDSILVGRVKVPATGGKGQIIPINIQPNQLQSLHARLVT
jgi:hypothetical protein